MSGHDVFPFSDPAVSNYAVQAKIKFLCIATCHGVALGRTALAFSGPLNCLVRYRLLTYQALLLIAGTHNGAQTGKELNGWRRYLRPRKSTGEVIGCRWASDR